MSESGWESWPGGLTEGTPRQHFKLTLTDFDMQRMDRERLEMIQAGVRLIERAFSERQGPHDYVLGALARHLGPTG